MRRTTKFSVLVAITAALSLLFSGLARADELLADGDGLTPVASNSLDFGAVCPGTTVTKDVVIGVQRSSNNLNNVFQNGSTAALTLGTVTGTGYSASLPSASVHRSVTFASDWQSATSSTIATDTVTATVTFVAPDNTTWKDYKGEVPFTLTGIRVDGAALTRSTKLATVATRGTVCDTTAPTLTLPSNITEEATSASGRVVSFSATATDANPANPTVTCTPASGSTFSIATTTVNCSATDAAGNTATGSFTVTIRDTTAPTISNLPSNVSTEATSSSGAVVTFTNPSATDTVDGTRPVSCSPASGSTFAVRTTTVTCSAEDTRGNKASSTFSVTVSDTQAPVLVLPGDITSEATSASGAVVTYSATASDVVNGTRTVTCSPASGATFPLGNTTVTCTASDLAGNTANGSFKISVRDRVGPEIDAPVIADSIEATSPQGAVVNYTITGSDDVSGSTAVTCDPASGSTFPIGTTKVDCESTDGAGNRTTTSFTVTVVDTTPPDLTVPADQLLEATSAAGALATFSASATDIGDSAPTVTCDEASGSTFPLGDTTVTCTARDASGNVATGSFKITVEDTTGPEIAGTPAEFTVEAVSPAGAVATYTAPTANDLVSGTTAVACAPASGATFALGSHPVTCSSTDAAGNTLTSTFNVIVSDTKAPVLTLPADDAIEAEDADGARFTYAASASDAVDGNVPVSCDKASGSVFAIGETLVTCEAADAGGRKATGSFTVTVSDTTRPELTVPSNITEEATGSDGAAVAFATSATDAVTSAPTISCDRASGSTFSLGTTTVTCTATDRAGNVDTDTFNITVRDTVGPVIEGTPTDFTVEAASASGSMATYTAPTANDLVSGTTAVACAPASGATFGLGSNPVTCSSTDGAGNLSTTTFNVIVSDTTAPVLALPASFTREAEGPDGADVAYTASADDAVDGDVPVSCDKASGVFAIGATLVTCKAQDKGGREATGSFTVTVSDTTRPELTVPSNITEEATGSDGAAVAFATSATDAVTRAPSISCDQASGSTFSLGTTTVTCTATDRAGNVDTETFNITVRDTTKPALNLPSNKTEEATGASGAAVSYNPSANDLVSGSTAVTCLPESGSTFRIGTWTVNCESTDGAGNKAVGSFTVTVQDTTAPALTLPANKTKEATGPNGATASYSPTATDIVDGDVPVNCDPASGSTFDLGTTTVMCESTDSANKKATGSFTVTVQDTTGPVLDLPANLTVQSTHYRGTAVTYSAAADDAVDGNRAVNCTPASGSNFPIGETTVNCTSSDSRGNQSTGSFKVTVEYTGPTYQFGGYKAPIDRKPTINKAKAGSAIPVKFSLGGYQGMDIFEKAPTAPSYGCAGGTLDTIETIATAGSSGLTYDAASDTYTYVWKSSTAMVNTCRTLTLHLMDGQTPTALFTFVK